ncbi:MAG: hypothetical protein HY738_19075 [Bacteroidia bacterium]|nr:hypothetical protein [Bacteroidia bacterium]
MKNIIVKYMTFKEMQSSYPNTWILVSNPVSEPASADIISGYFLYKNKIKKRVLEKSKDLKVEDDFIINLLRIIYTGEIKLPKNHIVCL